MKLLENIKRKKEDSNKINNANEVKTHIQIPTYAPNQGLMPVEYQQSPTFTELEKNIFKECYRFIAKAKPDGNNGSYMDVRLNKLCDEAIENIRVQRCDHVHTISKPLYDLHTGDITKLKKKLECFVKAKEEVDHEFNKYKKIYFDGTSLAEE